MNWKDKLPSCFGDQDKIFCGHASEQENAIEMIALAHHQHASWADVRTAIREHLTNLGCPKKLIAEQIKKAKDISSYFKA
jgi:hypothetical protein